MYFLYTIKIYFVHENYMPYLNWHKKFLDEFYTK